MAVVSKTKSITFYISSSWLRRAFVSGISESWRDAYLASMLCHVSSVEPYLCAGRKLSDVCEIGYSKEGLGMIIA
jgi:hypothetical protein